MKTTRSARRCAVRGAFDEYAIAPAMRTSRSAMSPISAAARAVISARRASRAGRSASQYRREPSAERFLHSSTLSLGGLGRSLTQRETELLETPSLATISS